MRGLFPALLLAACGDVYADPGGGGGGASSSVPPTTQPSPGGGPVDFPTQCPTGRPRENTVCNGVGTCEYGSSADRACNDVLSCTITGWTRRPSEGCLAHVCPSDSTAIAALDGQPCSLDTDAGSVNENDEAICQMSDGICACTTGRDGAHAHPRRWVCTRPLSFDCPLERPLAGTGGCAGQLWCDYGSCLYKGGTVMECRNGAWATGGLPCD